MATTRFGEVALAGAPNVGKSSLLNALVGQPLAMISAKAQATRVPTIGLVTRGSTQIVIHDLPGFLDPATRMHARMMDAALEVLRRVDAVVHLHLAGAGAVPLLGSLAPNAAMTAAIGKLPVVVALTKGDLARPATPAGIITSAATGEGIDRLLDQLETLMPAGEWRFPDDEVGTQPVRFFVGEYLREAAFELLDDEVPYAFAAEVEEFREDRSPVYIRATLYVERDSQKGIVVGAGGRTIKAIGRHARTRLEALLGNRVYLETWVKVAPKWREHAETLTRLGLPERAGGER